MTPNSDSVLLETNHFRIEHSNYYRIPGFLFVIPKAQADSLDDLCEGAKQELGPVLAKAQAAIAAVINPEKIYTSSFGESNSGLHFHIFPRTRDLTSLYRAEVDPGDELDGPGIMSWANRTFINGNDYGDIPATIAKFREYFQRDA